MIAGTTGELAFRYCYVPEGQLLTKTRLIRAAGQRPLALSGGCQAVPVGGFW